MPVTLVTGFPSFAARKLVEELVAHDDGAIVHAVVRNESLAEATAILDALPLDERRRVNVLEGDAAAIDLGLSGAELRAITPDIEFIHHLAQVSYMGSDLQLATHVNVGGAREIVELATLCPKLRCLVYHSTAQVSGDRTGLVLEDELDEGQSFRNPIESTLARGERIVRSKMSKLPIAVVRPTIVVGDSRSGEVDRFDGPYFLILLLVTSPPDIPLPLPGRGDAPLNLVPVDYYVRAAVAIGRDPRAPGRTFHIGDPTPLTARRIFDLVARAGGRRSTRGFIPANLTKVLLRTPGLDRVAKSPRAFLETLATPVTYSLEHTNEVLANTTVRCQPFEAYVDGLVEYVNQRLRERRASRDAPDREVDPLG